MDTRVIKPVLIGLMVYNLVSSLHNPVLLFGFLISSLLYFGLTILEERHEDRVVDLKKKHEEIDQKVIHINNKITLINEMLDAFKLRVDTLGKMEDRLDKLEPEKLKLQIQTLIDSNNQLVLNMRNQSGGF